ncbi:MAG: helix-turn-helix domain-containing protein [Acutalibacteraceae bacterium]
MDNHNLTNMIITELCGVYVCEKKSGTVSVMCDRQSIGLSFKIYGKSEFYQNGKTYISDSKTVIFLPKGASYSAKTVSDSECIVVNFNAENADFSDELLQIPIAAENIDALISELKALSAAHSDEFGQYRCMSKLYEIFELLFCHNAKSDGSALGLVIEYIDSNIGKANITNAELAAVVGYSEVYFRKLFKRRFGISPIQYVISRKISYAKQLLNGQYRIAEVAEKCGFNSVYHFSREFKRQTGKSPTEFAKQNLCF